MDKTEPRNSMAIAATIKAEKLYERCGFARLERTELFEQMHEVGEAIETRYLWSLMRRDLPSPDADDGQSSHGV